MNTFISQNLKKTADRINKGGKVVRISEDAPEQIEKPRVVVEKDEEIKQLKQELAEIKDLLKKKK